MEITGKENKIKQAWVVKKSSDDNLNQRRSDDQQDKKTKSMNCENEELIDPEDQIRDKMHAAEPVTMKDKSKPWNEQANDTGLLLFIKQKDEKINRMKMKMAILKDQLDQERTNARSSTLKEVLEKIGKESGNRFNSIEDCISVLKQLSEYSLRYTKTDFPKDDQNPRNSPILDKQKYFEKKIEDLHDEIYDLQSKLMSQERKYKKTLKFKDIEIEELQEELAIATTNRPRDLKSKARIKELEENVEELEANLESINKEIFSKEKKIKELVSENNALLTTIDQITNQMKEKESEVKRLKDDKEELDHAMTNFEQESLVTATKNNELLEKKQKAIDTMKEKIEHFSKLANEWKLKADDISQDLDKCRQRLDAEQEASEKSNVLSKKQETKIKQMEEKIKKLEEDLRNSKIDKFQKSEATKENTRRGVDNDVVEDLTKPEIKGPVMLACPNCQTMYDVGEIEDHIIECLEKSF